MPYSLLLVNTFLFIRMNDADNQSPDFDDMSSFFPCEIGDAIQYINLGLIFDKKCINKGERVRHLPGYCP